MAAGYDHRFVLLHAPLLTSSWNHPTTHGAAQLRALLEAHDVDIAFFGHNHAYERSHPLRGDAIDPSGTVYLTTGSAGALTDGIDGDWFTAWSYQEWTGYGDLDSMTTYLLITVDGLHVEGKVVSLGDGDVDHFFLPRNTLFADGFESGSTQAWSTSAP